MNSSLSLMRYLNHSGFAFDPSAFSVMLTEFMLASPEQREEFADAAKNLGYKEYLQTVYWGIIRGRIIASKKYCGFCGSDRSLRVHHVRYENRGKEWNHLGDLDLLCNYCHKRRHSLASSEELKKISKYRLSAGDRRLPVGGGGNLRKIGDFIEEFLRENKGDL